MLNNPIRNSYYMKFQNYLKINKLRIVPLKSIWKNIFFMKKNIINKMKIFNWNYYLEKIKWKEKFAC